MLSGKPNRPDTILTEKQRESSEIARHEIPLGGQVLTNGVWACPESGTLGSSATAPNAGCGAGGNIRKTNQVAEYFGFSGQIFAKKSWQAGPFGYAHR